MSMIDSHPPQIHRWTRNEYQKMGETGIFSQDARVELIEGIVIDKSPQTPRHAAVVMLASDILREIFNCGYIIRNHGPLGIGLFSEPEPDVAVLQGAPRDYLDDHPSTALLVVEVSDSSLAYDRMTKASLYARTGIQDYWVLNLIDRQIEVYRNPGQMENQEFDFGYTETAVYTATATVTLLAAPDQPLRVADLLP